jgi:lysozyme
MQLSPKGRQLIQGFEGLMLTAYKDPPLAKQADGSDASNQNYSIGYGHSGAYNGQTISREEANRLFDADAIKYETAVSYTTPVATQEQFDAMTSLTYNIGTAGFAKSSVAARHNMGDYAGAADAFMMWVKAAGQVNPTLQARRQKERDVYVNGYRQFYSEPLTSPVAISAPERNPLPWKQVAIGSLLAAGLSYLIGVKTTWLPFKIPFRKGRA